MHTYRPDSMLVISSVVLYLNLWDRSLTEPGACRFGSLTGLPVQRPSLLSSQCQKHSAHCSTGLFTEVLGPELSSSRSGIKDHWVFFPDHEFLSLYQKLIKINQGGPLIKIFKCTSHARKPVPSMTPRQHVPPQSSPGPRFCWMVFIWPLGRMLQSAQVNLLSILERKQANFKKNKT